MILTNMHLDLMFTTSFGDDRKLNSDLYLEA